MYLNCASCNKFYYLMFLFLTRDPFASLKGGASSLHKEMWGHRQAALLYCINMAALWQPCLMSLKTHGVSHRHPLQV